MRNTWIVAAAAAGLTAAGFGSAWAQEKQDQAPTAKMQGQDQTGAANNMDKQGAAQSASKSDVPSMGESQKPNGKVGPFTLHATARLDREYPTRYLKRLGALGANAHEGPGRIQGL